MNASVNVTQTAGDFMTGTFFGALFIFALFGAAFLLANALDRFASYLDRRIAADPFDRPIHRRLWAALDPMPPVHSVNDDNEGWPEPSCDVCGILAENTGPEGWCGACGNCGAHCEHSQVCRDRREWLAGLSLDLDDFEADKGDHEGPGGAF